MLRKLLAAAAFAALTLTASAQQVGSPGLTSFGVGPGLTNALGTANGTPVGNSNPNLYTQVNPIGYATGHTVLSSEMGNLLVATAGSTFAFTLPVVNTAGFQQGQSICFFGAGTGGFTITSGSTINGPTTYGQNGNACAVSDNTNSAWQIQGFSGGVFALLNAVSSEFTNTSGTLNLTSNGVSLGKLATQTGGTVLGNTGTGTSGPSATNHPVLGVPATSTGAIGFAGSTAGTTTLTTPNNTTNHTVTLPADKCGSGQGWTDNGSGVMACASIGTGSVTSVAPGAGLTTSATCVAGTVTAITGSGTICTDAAWFVGQLGGLGLSNDGSLPNTTVDVGVGSAASDDATVMMKLGSAYTKTTGAWALGTAAGCLDTGSVAASTWYSVFLIERPDTGVTDILCSTSATSPTFPTNYTKKRRIGSIKTDGSVHILAFTQVGSKFYWAASVLDVNDSTLTTSNKLETLGSVPLGVKIQPLCRYTISNGSTASVLLSSPDEDLSAPTTTNPFSAKPGFDQVDVNLTGGDQNTVCPNITTNVSGQVNARATAASTTLAIVTRGWVETGFEQPIASSGLSGVTPVVNGGTGSAAGSVFGYGNLLGNSSFVAVRGAALTTGNNDLYTVPASRRAIIIGCTSYNSSGGSIVILPQIKVSGTYYPINTTSGQSSSTLTLTNWNGVPGQVLEPNDIFSVNTATNNGLNVSCNIVEYDSTSSVKSFRLLGTSTGDNTVYTVPAGKTAMVLALAAPAQSTVVPVGNGSAIRFCNDAGGSHSYYFNIVPNGGSIGSGNKFGNAAALAASTCINGIGGVAIQMTLSAGDFLSMNTTAGAATQTVWGTVIEQ